MHVFHDEILFSHMSIKIDVLTKLIFFMIYKETRSNSRVPTNQEEEGVGENEATVVEAEYPSLLDIAQTEDNRTNHNE